MDEESTTNMKRLICLFFCVCYSLLADAKSYINSVYVNSIIPIEEQVNKPNTRYIFRSIIDLNGNELQCPINCLLEFRRGSLIKDGTIKGNHTSIKTKCKRIRFLKNVKFTGVFDNQKSYLSWWLFEEDITSEINSLFRGFSGNIYLDVEGTISNCVYIYGKEKIVVDGCGNHFTLKNIPNNCFFAQNNNQIELKNINIGFSGCNTTGTSAIMRCFRVEHTDCSIVYIHDISIDDFSNLNEKPCSFIGINVMYCNEGTTTIIRRINISNIKVKGDGMESIGSGGNYGIEVACNSQESGIVEISSCNLSMMANVDSDGSMVYEDTSGIYLAGIYSLDDIWQYCHWHSIIRDCAFVDVSKRNIKVQGDYAIIYNISSDNTESFLQDFKNMYVGCTGNYLTVEKLRGRYDGTIIKITGDYLNARNIRCSSLLQSSNYARVFTLDGCIHAEISDCHFDNDTYIFIYPTQKNFTPGVKPIYSFSNCNLNVKHLLYCVTKQDIIFENGILEVNDSNLRLSSTICFNGQALAQIVFNNTKVEYLSNLSIPKKNSTSLRIVENNSKLKAIR